MIKAKSVFLLFFLILLIAMNPAKLEAREQLDFSPYLPYSSYLGGSGCDYSKAIAIDEDGNIYVVGETGFLTDPDFPITFGDFYGRLDAFIAKFDSQGNLIWCTCLGGIRDDLINAIATDEDRNIYITGTTWSSVWFPDFPVTFGAFSGGNGDGFVAKLDSQGNPIWFRYLGGSDSDNVQTMALDENENICIAGTTSSLDWPPDFPVIFGVHSGDIDVFIAKLDSQGNPTWFRYLGGSYYDLIEDMALDEAENLYLVGWTGSDDFPTTLGAYDREYADLVDTFVVKLDSQGYVIWSTYIGGMKLDISKGIAVDEDGNVYVAGFNLGGDFPVTDNAFDPFYSGWYDIILFKLNSEGTNLIYSTYAGESEDDAAFAMVLDSDGNPCITGITRSSNLLPDFVPYISGFSGEIDIFLIKFNSEGMVTSFTYLGGSGVDVIEEEGVLTIDENGDFWLTGYTESDDFPVSDNAFDPDFNGWHDVFVSKISPPIVSLTISAAIGGTTDPEPGTYIYDLGIQVQVEAIPDSGYRFNGWTGDIPEEHEDDNPITILMDSDKFVEANFIRQYNLIVSAGTGGTTNPRPGAYIYDEGAEATITAIPRTRSGYKFSRWSGDAWGADNPITITMDSDKSITAHFAAIPDEPEPDNCFIATAAYGTPLHPHIDVLRNFRDKYLMPYKLGQKLVKFYYKYSPSVADLIRKSKILKTVVRTMLFPLVALGD